MTTRWVKHQWAPYLLPRPANTRYVIYLGVVGEYWVLDRLDPANETHEMNPVKVFKSERLARRWAASQPRLRGVEDAERKLRSNLPKRRRRQWMVRPEYEWGFSIFLFLYVERDDWSPARDRYQYRCAGRTTAGAWDPFGAGALLWTTAEAMPRNQDAEICSSYIFIRDGRASGWFAESGGSLADWETAGWTRGFVLVPRDSARFRPIMAFPKDAWTVRGGKRSAKRFAEFRRGERYKQPRTALGLLDSMRAHMGKDLKHWMYNEVIVRVRDVECFPASIRRVVGDGVEIALQAPYPDWLAARLSRLPHVWVSID